MVYHNPVLLSESIDSLNILNDGIYVDLTFGGGGHSKLILDNLYKIRMEVEILKTNESEEGAYDRSTVTKSDFSAVGAGLMTKKGIISEYIILPNIQAYVTFGKKYIPIADVMNAEKNGMK